MVNVSHESVEETVNHLRRMITRCDLATYSRTYCFEEFPLSEMPRRIRPDALAVVRDDDVWSQLVPSDDTSRELFSLWRFHFREGDDNSGFVGWLADHLKRKLGTGIFVVCGQNSDRAGIFDYWGCPAALGGPAIAEVRKLVRGNAD